MVYEGLLPICIGIYALITAYGYIPISSDPTRNAIWMAKYSTLLKICGPFSIFFGCIQIYYAMKGAG